MKIIIADTSAVVRAIFEQNLQKYSGLQIIASVPNSRQLALSIQQNEPDVIICGFDLTESIIFEDFKKFAMSNQLPILFLAGSDEELIKSKSLNVSESMLKPKLNSYDPSFFDSVSERLSKIISQAPRKCASGSDTSSSDASFKILCIGASTGGPSAVSQVLKGLGKNFPLPVLYAQHVEVGADENLAMWLSGECHNIHVTIAKDGEEAKPAHVYMAPADRHLVIDYAKSNGTPVLHLSDEEPERFLRPAVNKLFRSAAQFYKQSCLAVLLTGMGMDGADGCKVICDKGGWTIVEDKSTCTVFGMPAAAIEAGGAKEILPRGDISNRILELVKK
ncbi:response regulator [Treponema ruminis]|uniref:protein-glutamate methylesterase n=1 Tax=Treponema ruminis TaxID=744515 RepID=A0A7W8LM86_9SPIR|nr:chemotaxis protein CheB [Treponema ruminis]MBB5226264.1 two-component system chemotaxis response regulator CheB [Treponema ruminis]QSI02829.1 response regulator [Treponema ruminis]